MKANDKPANTRRNIITNLEIIAIELDQSCRSGEIETAKVETAQQYLNKVADILVDGNNIATDVYILYEAQALIHWIQDESDEATELIESARTVKEDNELLTVTGRELLASTESSLAQAGEEDRVPMPKSMILLYFIVIIVFGLLGLLILILDKRYYEKEKFRVGTIAFILALVLYGQLRVLL